MAPCRMLNQLVFLASLKVCILWDLNPQLNELPFMIPNPTSTITHFLVLHAPPPYAIHVNTMWLSVYHSHWWQLWLPLFACNGFTYTWRKSFFPQTGQLLHCHCSEIIYHHWKIDINQSSYTPVSNLSSLVLLLPCITCSSLLPYSH